MSKNKATKIKPDTLQTIQIISTKSKTTRQKCTNIDCLICVLRWSITLSAIIGIAPIIALCQHSKMYHSKKAHFGKSNVSIFVSVLLIVSIVPSLVWDLIFYFEDTNDKTKMIILQQMCLISLQIMPFAGIISGIATWKKRANILNSFCSIIENKEYFGIKTILGNKKSKCLKFRANLYLFLKIFLVLVHIGQLVYFLINRHELSPFYLYKSYITVFCFISHLSHIYNFIIDMNVEEIMLGTICDELECCIDEAQR